jgi:hypothetical protein
MQPLLGRLRPLRSRAVKRSRYALSEASATRLCLRETGMLDAAESAEESSSESEDDGRHRTSTPSHPSKKRPPAHLAMPGDAEYYLAFERVLLPIAREFDPDLVIVSAGFDAARGDPLGCCDVSPSGFAALTAQLQELSEGRLVMLLEGGYNLDSIANSFAECTKVLLGDTDRHWTKQALGSLSASPVYAATVEKCRKVQSRYWKSVRDDS